MPFSTADTSKAWQPRHGAYRAKSGDREVGRKRPQGSPPAGGVPASASEQRLLLGSRCERRSCGCRGNRRIRRTLGQAARGCPAAADGGGGPGGGGPGSAARPPLRDPARHGGRPDPSSRNGCLGRADTAVRIHIPRDAWHHPARLHDLHSARPQAPHCLARPDQPHLHGCRRRQAGRGRRRRPPHGHAGRRDHRHGDQPGRQRGPAPPPAPDGWTAPGSSRPVRQDEGARAGPSPPGRVPRHAAGHPGRAAGGAAPASTRTWPSWPRGSSATAARPASC